MASDKHDSGEPGKQACLQCRVCKLTRPIAENVRSIERFPKSYWIASIDDDGCANITKLCRHAGETSRDYIIEGVASIQWKESQGEDNVLVCSRHKDITEYSLHGYHPSVVNTWPIADIQKEISNKGTGVAAVNSLLIVGSYRTSCLLLINQSVFVTLKLLANGQCDFIGCFVTLHGQESHLPLYYISANHLVALSAETESLYMFDFVSGLLWCHIDLQWAKLNLTNQLAWKLSHDFVSLILIAQDWMLHHISLDAYVRTYPKSLKVEASIYNQSKKKVYTPNHFTCKFGDSKWRENLVSHHGNQHLNRKRSGKEVGRTLSKSRRLVTGFKSKSADVDGLRCSETVIESRELPTELSSYTVESLELGQFALTLSLVHTLHENKAICVIDTIQHKLILKRLPMTQTVLLSSSPSLTHVILSDQYVFHVVTEENIEQEDLVSKLMLYGGASAADKLCDFNQWGRCTVPLHTLQIGIAHRQLDTVAFFLKSKENLFISGRQGSAASPSAQVEERQLWDAQFSHLDNVKQLESALNLLVQAVRENVGDQQSRDFANKLLTLTLEFLYTLVHNGLSLLRKLGQSETTSIEKKDAEKAVDVLMGHIAQLRQCLTVEQGIQKLVIPNREDVLDGNAKATASSLITEGGVEAAAMSNSLPLLQSHLLTRGENGRARYDHLVQSGMNQVLRYLDNRAMKSATSLLQNMGFDSQKKLWQLAEEVKGRDLQMYVLEELQSAGSLTPERVIQVEFLRQLYKMYPCASFSQSLMGRSGEHSSEWSEMSILATMMSSERHELKGHCGDLGVGINPGSQDGLYAEVILSWLRSWDAETRERILLEGQLQDEDFILELYSNRKLLWRYLLSHNRHDDALTLLDLMTREVNEDGGSAKQRQDSVSDLYYDLDLCTPYLKMEVTQRLTRKGFIQPEMLVDFPALMMELSRIGGVLSLPHPLHHLDQLTQHSFHQHFLSYCAQHRLVLPLWLYCNKHRLQLDRLEMEDSSLRSWLDSLQCFFNVAHNTEDTDALYQASQACAAHIWNMRDPSFAQLLDQGHVLAAMATMPYSPSPIHPMADTMRLELHDGTDLSAYQTQLKLFPKLYSALFPTGAIDNPSVDISVYQLLMGSAPLDPRRLFGWQEGNTVAGEECQRILPFFSQSDLVSRFAYTEKIRYPFYLKHGRPTFAFLSFLAEELDSGATTVSSKRVYTVCGVAMWIAVKNFTNTMVTSACVAFVEMCGQESLLLRTYIQAGSDILVHKNRGIMGNVEKRREIVQANEDEVVDIVQSCIRRRRQHGPRLVEALEKATSHAISRKGINSFEAAQHWMVTVTLCHLLHLPVTSVFLEECARGDAWLPFLWFAQCHQLPRHQLQGLLHQFRSRHLRDHLHYVIENADAKSSRKLSEQSESPAQSLTKDVRSSLYAKIGLSKGRETGDLSSEEEDAQNSLDFPQGQGHNKPREQHDMNITEESAPEDVFQVVFSSQSAPLPWKSFLQSAIVLRNSLFAELAACHQDSTIAPCLCGWLVAMMDRTEHAQFLEAHGKPVCTWGMGELETLIDVYMRRHWEFTLATGFSIFQPNSPFLQFLKFVAEVSQSRDYAACETLLGEFKEAMSNFSQGRQSQYSEEILGNCHWLEHTTNRLLLHQLKQMSSLYESVQLLRLLDQENIALVFSFDVPDYNRLRKITQILHANNLAAISIPAFLKTGSDTFMTESKKAVMMLVEKKSFSDAYKFAHLTDVTCDDITLQEMLTEKASLLATLVWRSKVTRSRFWKTCANKFKLNQVNTSKIVDFFMSEVAQIPDMSEKASIYQLCLELLPPGKSAEVPCDDIYQKMWNCRIQAKIAEQKGETDVVTEPIEDILCVLEVTEGKKPTADRSELLRQYKIPANRKQPHTEESGALDVLVSELLDEGRVQEAHQVVTVMAHYSQDLAVILTCIGLSRGDITRETMEPELRRLLTVDRRSRSSVGSFSGFSRTASTVSLSTASSSWDFLSVEKEDAIVVMERLLGHCSHGQQCCLRIITAFKIACILEIEFEEAVKGKEFSILDELLRTSFSQRFTLARDYLSTSSLTDDQVASFLSVSIINTLKAFMGGESIAGIRSPTTKEVMFNASEGMVMLGQFIKLCQDPSHLGSHLLEVVSAMGDNSDDPLSKQSLSIETELLIMAHECHTVACNMEGISHVLRAARICTDSLAKAEEFPTMIRLLTGVGRFSEMTYIFDALKQHHQFELLLRKGMEKENNLKTAVLDYLKRFHPEDKDSYTMVALKFTMYREIAHMLEDNGWRNLRALKDKPLENTREVQDILKESARYFSDAAESYVKDNCLRHAQQCLRQARLLALQLQHLASGIHVINLAPESVNAVIAQHPKFMESLIISEAYGKRASWSEALYHNVIVGGDWRYLQDLKSHIHLTTPIIHDALTRFQQSGNSSAQALGNIKKLLPLCKDICLQFRIAKELQLNDVTAAMLKSDSGSYLQDMMSLS